jgi:hypothetical protein
MHARRTRCGVGAPMPLLLLLQLLLTRPGVFRALWVQFTDLVLFILCVMKAQ